jgi:adenosylcobinamide amidohydrolase
VDKGYARTDLTAHVAEIVAGLGLAGEEDAVCALFTAADVAQVATAESGGVQAWATVGVTRPTWPVPDGARAGSFVPPTPGTVNVVVSLPVVLSPSALVQAVGTATEAKAQVLVQAGVPGTGTASDALVVLCRIVGEGDSEPAPGGAVEFAGVRSPWGAHLARAVHRAVAAGLAAHPWPADDVDPAVVW